MIKQLIFVVESDIDWMYISSTIRAIYDLHNIRIDYVSMNGKTNYKTKTVINKIADTKRGINGESKIIYCYDTDNIDSDINDLKLDKEITSYCNENGYELIWFCRDIEEVFVGEIIEDSNKRDVAENYARRIQERPYIRCKLNEENKKHKNSNFKKILNNILEKNKGENNQ